MGRALVAGPQRQQWAVIPASAITVTPKERKGTEAFNQTYAHLIF